MRAIVVVGMGYGDEGKGSIVDYLVRKHEAHTVVRFNGGAQAQHRVVLPDGRSHIFSQFGSGTLVKGVETYLSRFMMVNPQTMFNEHEGLKKIGFSGALSTVVVDYQCPITTPFHIAANRIRTLVQDRDGQRHGTTGMGIGETMMDVLEGAELQAVDLTTGGKRIYKLLREIQERKRNEMEKLNLDVDIRATDHWRVLTDNTVAVEYTDFYRAWTNVVRIQVGYNFTGNTIFEGAQGALLDQHWGFAPHTTWSDTTPTNALMLIDEAGSFSDTLRLGVLRGYATRHGEGPFVTEAALDLPEPHVYEDWPGQFRVGYTDLLAASYAAHASPVDALALTCLDRIPYPWQICTRYQHPEGWSMGALPSSSMYEKYTPFYNTVDEIHLPNLIADAMDLPLHITSHGPTHNDKEEYPLWLQQPQK